MNWRKYKGHRNTVVASHALVLTSLVSQILKSHSSHLNFLFSAWILYQHIWLYIPLCPKIDMNDQSCWLDLFQWVYTNKLHLNTIHSNKTLEKIHDQTYVQWLHMDMSCRYHNNGNTWALNHVLRYVLTVATLDQIPFYKYYT